MNSENLSVLTNIIGAVESGGQIYGKRRYEAYAAPYQNSSNEVTITLGWAQNYGENARALVKNIFEVNKEKFRSIDDGSIEKILNTSWVTKHFNPTSKQKSILINLITSDIGKQQQDKMFQEDMKKYLEKFEELYGEQSIEAQMMWCEIVHLGGYDPAKRIFNRASKPWMADSIFASLKLDQNDKTNNNQVGDKIYQSRHECCVRWVKQYAKSEEVETTVGYSRKKIVELAKSWEGKNESDGSYKEIINIYNKQKTFPRGIKMQYSWAWCACFWSALALKLGYEKIIPIEISCYYLIEKAQSMGIWIEDDSHVPSIGEAVLYDWHDNGVGDNVGCPDHVGIVISVNKQNNTFVVMEGNYSNAVKRRTMNINGKYIRGFISPKYDDTETKEDDKKTNTKTETSKTTKIKEKPLYTMVCKYDSVAVRTYAGTEYSQLKSVPWLGVGNQVDYCDTVKAVNGENWYFVRIAYAGGHVFGFVRSDLLRKQ